MARAGIEPATRGGLGLGLAIVKQFAELHGGGVSADALAVLQRLLEGAAASVTTASCAEEALSLLSCERFDVIVSDIAMPGMDGCEFVGQLRKQSIITPAVALSASALPSDVAKATAAGFNAYLMKPMERESLLSTMSGLVI